MSCAQAAELIRKGVRFLVTCHLRPDADALGSALGLGAMLHALGKEAVVYVPGPIPQSLDFLRNGAQVAKHLPDGTKFDATFIMDAASPRLVPPLPPPDCSGPLVVVDHHVAYEEFGDLAVRESDACATGEVVLRLWNEVTGGAPIPNEAAEPLYAALAADTGNFRYPGTTSHTLRLGASLLDRGVDPWKVAYHLFERWPKPKMRLLQLVLRDMELLYEEQVALVCVGRETFEKAGATDEMLEGLVNYGRMLEGVRIAAMLWVPHPATWAKGQQEVRVSLRADVNTDASRIAKRLGGGGHRGAAGAVLE
ncbi:MAG: DHH family phosphoesterase, partial [Deltaproteobacteria bacterium]|nr:DHH family phosphoesterase [Deltaproteobacteria bacterium]